MNIKLSISLLASDRASSLERCLDSLKPLLMQIPSELIVVFTGTDEEVRKIAERYTDQVIPFTWCDDFSAARNTGLKAAKGEWFLFIDDDEWFEDVKEICDFFQTGEYQCFGSACYKVRNYLDWTGFDYSDFYAYRMSRIVPGLCFQNAIHEELVPTATPFKYFNTYAHHYGYVKDEATADFEKTSRNLPLLLQGIKEQPTYVKNYLQITQEYCSLKRWDKAEKYCRKGRRLCSRMGNDDFKRWLQHNLIIILYEKGNFEKAEEEAYAILEKEQPCEIVCLSLYIVLIAVCVSRQAWEDVLRYGRLYETTLAYMDENPQLWIQQTYGNLTEKTIKNPEKLYQIRFNCVEAAINLDDIKQAGYFLSLLPWEEEYWMQRYYPSFDSWKEWCGEYFQKLLKFFPEKSPYLLLQKGLGADPETQKMERHHFFAQCLDATESRYLQERTLKEAVISNIDLRDLVDSLDLDQWMQCTGDIINKFSAHEIPRARHASEVLKKSRFIYGVWLEKLLRERELCREGLINDRLISAMTEYAQCILQFYQELYRTDLFEIKKYNLLPRDCRFAILISEAMKNLKSKEYPEAIRRFRIAIRYYPSMTGVVLEVIRQTSRNIANPALNAGSEFQSLATQMKERLNDLLENKQYVQAGSLIDQLSPLLPEDLELIRMRQNVLRQMCKK